MGNEFPFKISQGDISSVFYHSLLVSTISAMIKDLGYERQLKIKF